MWRSQAKALDLALQPLGRRAHAVLVERVRGDAEFGDLVHLLGADLQLDALVAGTDHGGVERTVVVLLRRRDVVLEAAGHHRPGGVHDAERAVAGFDVVHHDAEAEDVGQLLEADRLALHLGPDRKRPLAPAIDMRGDAVLLQILGELAFDLADQVAVAVGERSPAAASPPHRLPDRACGTKDPRAPPASPACPCGRRAAHRCRASPRRCGGARSAARTPACACCAGGRRA